MQHDESQYLPSYWFSPVLPTWDQLQVRAGENFLLFNKMTALTTHLLTSNATEDTICEIAGGEARTTRVLIRTNDSRISTGPNFDLVADIDLTKDDEQIAFWKYRIQRKPNVCVAAPMCRSFGGLSRLNRVKHHSTWQKNHDTVDKPLAHFAGMVAEAQLSDGLDFVNEQPVGSALYEVNPWPEILKHPRVSSINFDQCQLGQKNSNGISVKKPTQLVHSDENLIYYFKGLTCGRFPKRGNGIHAPLTGKEAHAARIWPWDFARRLAWGIVHMMKRK